ncbi:MAG: 50S ribosomal protein L6 [Parcubacteria group bacterium GW2011_GWA2_43_17]|nr:MAG: 50S ribosomal protein L6 [Parcubacteria group bacterium GW2011_GWA2_43_17]KKT92755.1 MAG: 50S ribosomal protein L6 [Parcubacteria group bacterium GW2011_GWF2_45_11]KKT97099.1 MAG: 50S ribosomal protein L6 [Parcubacteria group bacterium GW2011_GWC2_45_15]OGY93346.1 MAG: 50S ribosomal protein L6 [Candidatus Komeilibacteria bacterium RIFOXYC2_FULL_45_12]OGY94921.1 MAG: 50S ribosomal protein L6 [Candidatus Komeilibacteria bacterium RIFOXYA2_FULL_45_9]HAH03947.1 50S ribosomal protein L6 [Ca
MSRIGKKPIVIPSAVEVKADNHKVVVKGPKGQLEQLLPAKVTVEVNAGEVLVKVLNEGIKEQKALWGLFRSLIFNMVEGVVHGFSKQLEINGIGFKAAVAGKNLVLNVGFSHTVEYPVPQGIEIIVDKNVITVAGADKQQVGQVAAEIRAIKKPEPYKGKGIKYLDEVIRRKAGKVVKGSE